MIIADHGLLAESIAAAKAADGWPYPTAGEDQCPFTTHIEAYGTDRCCLVNGHETTHYSGPGQLIWREPLDAIPTVAPKPITRRVTLLPVSQPRLIHKPYLALAILQIIDIATTGWILHYFTAASEGNPLAAHILNTTGLFTGLSILLALKLGMVYTFWRCQTGAKIVLAVYATVVLNNLLILFLWLLS